MLVKRSILRGALFSSWLATCGCFGSAEYAEVDYVPEYRDARVYTTYDGADVYYVRDHWYRRQGDGWVYYRSEPEELQRYRSRPVREAPPAYAAPRHHEHEHHEHERHEHEEHGEREAAPPADRVR